MIKRISSLFLISIFSVGIFSSFSVKAENGYGDTNQRLNNYVSKNSVVLDEQSTADVIAKCSAIQSQVANLQGATSLAVRKRLNIYGDIQNNIRAIELRMMRQGIDASELDLFTGKIQAKQNELTEAAADFGIAGDDIRLVNCQKHPEQFKAGLIEFKKLNSKVVLISKDLREMIQYSPNTTFGPLRSRLTI